MKTNHALIPARPVSLLPVLVALLAIAASPSVTAQTVYNPANGHYYELVNTPLPWPDARTAAAAAAPLGFTSHLATITSQEENDFIAEYLPLSWYAWLGGYQPDPSAAPAEGWAWVTGEAWDYTNWYVGDPNEPNDFYGPGSEHYLMFWGGPQWNDQYPEYATIYVVEYEPLSISIDGCDTGVLDVLLTGDTDASTISGLIAQCAAQSTNHGEFVSCVAELTNRLMRDGVITGKEKGAIQSCAAKAALP